MGVEVVELMDGFSSMAITRSSGNCGPCMVTESPGLKCLVKISRVPFDRVSQRVRVTKRSGFVFRGTATTNWGSWFFVRKSACGSWRTQYVRPPKPKATADKSMPAMRVLGEESIMDWRLSPSMKITLFALAKLSMVARGSLGGAAGAESVRPVIADKTAGDAPFCFRAINASGEVSNLGSPPAMTLRITSSPMPAASSFSMSVLGTGAAEATVATPIKRKNKDAITAFMLEARLPSGDEGREIL